MKILLPDQDMVLEEGVCEIKNGVLYLYKNGIFKEMMYKLSYMLFGEDECYYCHRKLRKGDMPIDKKKYFSQISMDHLIPQDFGGPTITNNLRPACVDCNSSKGNMFEDEFQEYRKLRQRTAYKGKQGRVERRLFKKNVQLTQELRRYGNIPSLPEEWYEEKEVKSVYVNFWMSQPKGSAYNVMLELAKKYNYLTEVATITGNGFLVDGFNAVLISKYYEIPIRAIILENVIYNGFPNEL